MWEKEYVCEKLNCFVCNENEIAWVWGGKKANIPTTLKELILLNTKNQLAVHPQQKNVGIKRMGIATEIEGKVQEKRLALLVTSCY